MWDGERDGGYTSTEKIGGLGWEWEVFMYTDSGLVQWGSSLSDGQRNSKLTTLIAVPSFYWCCLFLISLLSILSSASAIFSWYRWHTLVKSGLTIWYFFAVLSFLPWAQSCHCFSFGFYLFIYFAFLPHTLFSLNPKIFNSFCPMRNNNFSQPLKEDCCSLARRKLLNVFLPSM